MLGGTKKESSGAIGDQRGRVRNVASVFDREVVFDGSGDNHDAPFTDWAALNADTVNVESDANHVLGRYALTFDKAAGVPATIFAVLVNSSLDLDCGRFLAADRIVGLFLIPDITDVAYAAIRLGTDAGNYNEWRMADVAITPAVWQEFNLELRQCEIAVVGDGWNPADVKYAAFVVAFDLAADVLADVLLDHILVREHNALTW